MIINHNIAALNTYRQLSSNNVMGQRSLEKLSSGLRINRAGDDAAGLAISEKMRGQIRGLDQASRNAQDSISLIQTAEGALNETHSILQRMRELAAQAASDTNTDVDRGEIQKEINQLTDEIDRIANTTEFNTQKLLEGSKVGLRDQIEGKVTTQLNTTANVTAGTTAAGKTSVINATGTIIITRVNQTTANAKTEFVIGDPNGFGVTASVSLGSTLETIQISATSVAFKLALTNLKDMQVGESITISVRKYEEALTDASSSLSMQIGANSGQNILVGINDMKAEAIGVRSAGGAALDVGDYQKSTAAVTSINNAIELVSAERSKLGAVQNRLEHTINNLGTSSENLSAAESRIRDVDMAKEMMEFTKNSILAQAANAMLAQANQQPQNVLQLLR